MARNCYSLGFSSGTMAAGLAGGSPVLAIRWASTSSLCVIRSLRLSAGSLVAFTAGLVKFDLFTARAWSAADTDGGAVAWTVPGSGKRTAGAASSAFVSGSEIRVSTTATLTAGTRTLDTSPLATLCTSVANTAGAPILPPMTQLVPGYPDHPIVLSAASAATSTGLVLQATVPATGTWHFSLAMDWEEMTRFSG